MNEQLKIIITAAIDDLKKKMDEAEKAVGNLGDISKKASKTMKDAFDKVSKSIKETLPKAIDVGKKALAGLSLAFGLVTKGTQEYRNEQAKLLTAFEAAGSSAEEAKQTYNGLYRVLGESDRAVEAAGHIAKLTKNEQHMAEWTKICQGIYATFGDSLPIEGLTEAANETAKVGTVTGVLADALNWAGVSEDAFNESLAACVTEQEREALIRETLNGLYDDAANKFEENNALIIAQNEAQASLTESLAAIGAALTPLLTYLTQLTSDVLVALTPYIQSFAETYLPIIQEKFEAIPELIADFNLKLQEAKTWIDENSNALTLLGIALGTVTAAVLAYNAQAIIKKALDIAETAQIYLLIAADYALAVAKGVATAATTAFGAAVAFLSSPITLIILAIGALIAVVVLLWKNWDDVSAWMTKAMDKVKNAVSNWVSGVSANLESFKNNMVNKFNQAKENVLRVFDNIMNGVRDKIGAARDFVGSAIDKIKSFFKFEWSLPKLKLPHVSISGSFSLMPPSVPHFSIAWYAKGGVFDNPTLFPYGGSIGGLGEAGAEAIVPLENNTEWLDKIAERLAEKSGTTPIILQVDGKTFAQTSISTINQLTRQSGKLELNLY